ncbi:MAG TPA: hypothetical protein DD420_21835 [Streptomyces sp.]|nr:hypothetical protein [Streptomyces sp.]
MTGRKPRRNKAGGKLAEERAKAGVAGAPSGIHSLDPEEGELFEHDPSDISPNPMNQRLGLRNMAEMIDSVRRQGVHTPGAVMHTDLFMEMYPEWAAQVPHPERTYILGPGHRRREAALEAGEPMLLILRDRWAKERTVEENLISENNDRENLTPIEQALQLHLLRQRGLTGEEIAERCGYGSRGTVTRILNLLDLPQEIQTAVHEGDISQSAGYTLSTIKDETGKNDSEAAHKQQLMAFGWMRDEQLTAEAAKNRLVIRSSSPMTPTRSAEAGEAPPSNKPKDAASPAPVSRGKHEDGDGTAEAAATSSNPKGEPSIPHPTSSPEPTAGEPPTGSEQPQPEGEDVHRLAATQSAEQRDLACRLLLAEEKYAAASDVTALLANAVLNPAEWKQAAARAHHWLRALQKGPDIERPSAYFDAVSTSADLASKRRAAFAIALAANEVRAAQPDRAWDARDRAHLEFLIASKAAYQPTAYEQGLLGLTYQEAK